MNRGLVLWRRVLGGVPVVTPHHTLNLIPCMESQGHSAYGCVGAWRPWGRCRQGLCCEAGW